MDIPVTDEQIETDAVRGALLPPGCGLRRRSTTCWSDARSSAASCPSGATRPEPIDPARRQGLRGGRAGLRQADGGHHDGLRPAAPGPDAGHGVRAADRADHPRRGADLRHGLVLPDGQDLQPEGAEVHRGRPRALPGLQGIRTRPDPARRDQRGRLDGRVHRRRHQLRHPRRADDPGLRLLLDVRVPADRRLDVGGDGPDGPRLHHRGDRRSDHADRRGSAARRRALADPGLDEPGDEGLRPGLRLRDRPHRAGRDRADVRRRTPTTRTSCTT